MKVKDRGVFIVVMMLMMIGTAVFATESTSVLVDSDYSRNKHWMTVYTNEVFLTWEWNTNATYATLDVQGMNGSVATNFFQNAASNWLWQAFASSVPTAEDVYDLTMTFYTDSASGLIVGALTSRLAIVTGSFGETPVNPVEGSRSWSQVKNNVVIPYDAFWPEAATNATSAQLVIANEDGVAATNAFADVAGYTGWKVRKSGLSYGTFDLTLTFPGTTNEWQAVLTRLADGTVVKMR